MIASFGGSSAGGDSPHRRHGNVSFMPHVEVLRVRLAGAPLVPSEPEDPGAGPPAAVFLFEVSGHSAFQPWHIQRSFADFGALHATLAHELRGQLLPKLPEERHSRVGKLFKSREERKVNALAEELETYMNTVLLLPAAQGCPVIADYLEVPVPVVEEEPPPPPPSAAELRGAAAADALVDTAGSVCQTMRSFCDSLVGRASNGRRTQQDFADQFADHRASGSNISLQELYAECLEDQVAESREDILRRVRERARTGSIDSSVDCNEGNSPLVVQGRQALNLPTNIKVKEWK